MSDALPLPPRPNLEQYKKLAKDLQSACKSGDAGVIREWAAGWVETLSRLRGQSITPEVQKERQGDIDRVERVWQKSQKSNELVARCTLTGAQFFIAHCHGFTSWPKFVKHLEALNTVSSPVSTFEMAVDAIVTGDAATLVKAVEGQSRAGAHPFYARASLDPAPLCLRERSRGLPSEDAEEHCRDRQTLARRRRRRECGARRRMAAGPQLWDWCRRAGTHKRRECSYR